MNILNIINGHEKFTYINMPRRRIHSIIRDLMTVAQTGYFAFANQLGKTCYRVA